MESAEQTTIVKLYEALGNRDGEGMAECYHDNCTFEDPVFGKLEGKNVGNMWRMLTKRASNGIEVKYHGLKSQYNQGEVTVEAIYEFSKTKRIVHNIIHATFIFKEGKILEQKDHFDFWRWSRMALGPVGLFLGWTPFLKNKIRNTARASLLSFTQSKNK